MATPFSTLRTVTLADLLKRQFPPREDLLEGLLRQGASLLLWAATGVGKTMVSLSMALAIAGGGSFLGWQNKAPRKVLYVDGEMNLEDLQGRLVALMAGMPGLNTESAGENITLLSRQDQDPSKPFLDIASDEGQSAIARQSGCDCASIWMRRGGRVI